MVTARGSGRWVFPKGWAELHVPPHALAAREAFEEAGVIGAADPASIGTYRARKRLADGRRLTRTVDVFALRVDGFAEAWPERGQRESRWFTLEEAAARVREKDLARMLRGVAGRIGGP